MCVLCVCVNSNNTFKHGKKIQRGKKERKKDFKFVLLAHERTDGNGGCFTIAHTHIHTHTLTQRISKTQGHIETFEVFLPYNSYIRKNDRNRRFFLLWIEDKLLSRNEKKIKIK